MISVLRLCAESVSETVVVETYITVFIGVIIRVFGSYDNSYIRVI
jgi:rRNA processing protein Gar1